VVATAICAEKERKEGRYRHHNKANSISYQGRSNELEGGLLDKAGG
jgi:hypothetical protein